MTNTHMHWNLPDPVPEKVNSELESFTPPFRSVLFRRGCETSHDAVNFLVPQAPLYSSDLDLRHLEIACRLIKEMVANKCKIGVFGDYDVDGITATALLTQALLRITPQVTPMIPNRIQDGYGLKKPAIDTLHQQGIELLITVDNGISSRDEVAYAKSLGMGVIITDHHQPPAELPDADAVINPKLPDDPYPNKHLAGVGVVYKLVSRLADDYPEIDPDSYLDLVALGTVADIVPLIGENRSLVKQGLIQINQRPRQSLQSVLGAAGLLGQRITASDISFQIAPRFNSSGRLADANHLVPLTLLLSNDPAVCGKHAQLLEIHNDRRKRISREMQDRIEAQVSTLDPLPSILIAIAPEHDPGVAGIAAGHLTRNYYLPAIVGAVGEKTTTASCRSIPEFDLVAALNDLSDLLLFYGGHRLAAGFTLENSNLPAFMDRMTTIAENKLSEIDLHPTLEIDAIVDLSELGTPLHRELIKLEPTGEWNPQPIFVTRNLSLNQVSKVGRYGEHLKFVVDDGTKTLPAIGFGLSSMADQLTGKVDLAYHFDENEFRGKKEFQLQVLDLKPSP